MWFTPVLKISLFLGQEDSVQGDPDSEVFQSLYFSLSRKYTFRPRPKPSGMPICIYNYMYTPPPSSLPSTILPPEEGEKVILRLMIIHPSKGVGQAR